MLFLLVPLPGLSLAQRATVLTASPTSGLTFHILTRPGLPHYVQLLSLQTLIFLVLLYCFHNIYITTDSVISNMLCLCFSPLDCQLQGSRDFCLFLFTVVFLESRAEFLNLSAIDISCWIILCCGNSPGHCTTLTSIPGLRLLEASTTLYPVVTTGNVSRLCQMPMRGTVTPVSEQLA